MNLKLRRKDHSKHSTSLEKQAKQKVTQAGGNSPTWLFHKGVALPDALLKTLALFDISEMSWQLFRLIRPNTADRPHGTARNLCPNRHTVMISRSIQAIQWESLHVSDCCVLVGTPRVKYFINITKFWIAPKGKLFRRKFATIPR